VDAPIDLNLLRTFAVAHETGSFSAAAKRLRVPRSTVSRAVTALEEATGALLFHRTTRKVTSTRAGAALFDRIEPWLVRLEAAARDIPEASRLPGGTLRITAPADLGEVLLAEAVARYGARYPDTRVEVALGPRVVDLAKEGFDMALRFARGPLPGAGFVTRRLGKVAFALFASPVYLARRGTPRALAELASHDVVAIGGASGALPGKPRVVCDDKAYARALLRAGGGIGLLPTYLAADDVADGRLVRVLPSHEVESGAVYLVLPSNRHVPSRVTAFRDLLEELLRRTPLG